jgi:hypothetical protein
VKTRILARKRPPSICPYMALCSSLVRWEAYRTRSASKQSLSRCAWMLFSMTLYRTLVGQYRDRSSCPPIGPASFRASLGEQVAPNAQGAILGQCTNFCGAFPFGGSAAFFTFNIASHPDQLRTISWTHVSLLRTRSTWAACHLLPSASSRQCVWSKHPSMQRTQRSVAAGWTLKCC